MRVQRRYDVVDAIIAAAWGLRFREAWYTNYAIAEHEAWTPIQPNTTGGVFDPSLGFAQFSVPWEDYGDEVHPRTEYRLHTDGLCYFRGVIQGSTSGPWLDNPVITLPGRIAPQSLAYTWASAWLPDSSDLVERVMLSALTAGLDTMIWVRTNDNIAGGERMVIPLNGFSFPYDEVY